MLLRKTNILLSALVLFLAASVPVFAAYNESGGLVIMEMENTQSALGLWQARNGPLTGYTGSGYLEFTGNKTTNGPPQSPLVFKFVINKAGLYYLHLH
ncbi:MAG: hypothetical protein R3236_10715, partial [Phycisphaeraceae bacterium]|nr:hypothetical protein [Phycisphaeraceae bacterium]